MKNIRKMKAILLGCFYGGVFVAQMIGWIIVNYMGNFENTIGCIIGNRVK